MEESDMFSTAWKEDNNRMRAALEKDLKGVKAEWATRLKGFEDSWLKKVSQLEQIVKEMEAEISQITKMREACVKVHLQTLALLRVKEEELNQSEEQRESKCGSLEESFREELDVKERWERRAHEPEEMWLTKQEEWIQRASKAEEEIKLLIVPKNKLQEDTLNKGEREEEGGGILVSNCDSKMEEAAVWLLTGRSKAVNATVRWRKLLLLWFRLDHPSKMPP